jgi:hypothetical protein
MNHLIRSRAELVTWIESCVLGDLRTLLVGVDAYYALAHACWPRRPPARGSQFSLGSRMLLRHRSRSA